MNAHTSFTSQPERRIPALALSITTALRDVGRAVPDADLIAEAAGFLAQAKDLDTAVDLLGYGIKQDAHRAQAVLISYRDALEEQGSPKLLIARLRREEETLRAQAERHLTSASDYWGKVGAYKGKPGRAEDVACWERGARAADKASAEAMDAAAEKAGAAEDIQRRLSRGLDLMGVVAGRAA